jgi:hypothetical protein
VAAAAPEPVTDSARPEEELRGSTHLVVEADLIPPDTLLAELSLPTQSLGDSLLAGTGGGGGLPVAGYAYSSSVTVGDFNYLDFGFEVDLGTGAMSNGYMIGSGTVTGVTFNISGGTGGFTGTEYEIHGFTGTPHTGGSSTGIWIAGAFVPGDLAASVTSLMFVNAANTYTDFVGSISAAKLP